MMAMQGDGETIREATDEFLENLRQERVKESMRGTPHERQITDIDLQDITNRIIRDKTMTLEQKIEEWFTYHSPTPEQVPKYQAIRNGAKELAHIIIANTPTCADQTVAIRKLREAVMVANQCIACGGL